MAAMEATLGIALKVVWEGKLSQLLDSNSSNPQNSVFIYVFNFSEIEDD